MDLKDLYARGLALRQKIFGNAAVEKRMQAFGEFGEPLQNIINAYAYGDVWSRTALPDATRSLAMIGITAASNRPAELRVHVQGALANGCTPEQIREVLLLVTMYCGIPAGNESHRVAYEVIQENAGRKAP